MTPAVSKSPVQSIQAPHLLTDTDLTSGELQALIGLASRVRNAPRDYAASLTGRSIALLFEKPSLRTRLTFELAIQQLGGFTVFQDHRDGRIGEREPSVRTVEAAIADPDFYSDPAQARTRIDEHQALMWEVGNLMNQWEALQSEADELARRVKDGAALGDA